jgi:hypothetical protein
MEKERELQNRIKQLKEKIQEKGIEYKIKKKLLRELLDIYTSIHIEKQEILRNIYKV